MSGTGRWALAARATVRHNFRHATTERLRHARCCSGLATATAQEEEECSHYARTVLRLSRNACTCHTR